MKLVRLLFVVGLLTVPAAANAAPLTQACVTLSEEGQELQRAGRLRAAIGRFSVCAEPACPSVIRKDCEEQLSTVTRAVPKLVVVVRDRKHDVVRDARIAIDQVVLSERVDDSELAVDPGIHTLEVAASGYATYAKTLVLAEGVKHEETVVLERSATPAQDRPRDGDARVHTGHDRQHVIALALGGAGLVGLGIGTVFGALASGSFDSAKALCPQPSACPNVVGCD